MTKQEKIFRKEMIEAFTNYLESLSYGDNGSRDYWFSKYHTMSELGEKVFGINAERIEAYCRGLVYKGD